MQVLILLSTLQTNNGQKQQHDFFFNSFIVSFLLYSPVFLFYAVAKSVKFYCLRILHTIIRAAINKASVTNAITNAVRTIFRQWKNREIRTNALFVRTFVTVAWDIATDL